MSFVLPAELGWAIVTDLITRLVCSFAFSDECLGAMPFN